MMELVVIGGRRGDRKAVVADVSPARVVATALCAVSDAERSRMLRSTFFISLLGMLK